MYAIVIKTGLISTCNFRSVKFKKKEAFFILHIFSIDAPITDKNHLSKYCTISHRGLPCRKIFKSNRGIRITFLSNPLFFSSFFLRTSNIKNCPKVLLNILNLYRPFLGVDTSHINQVKFLPATFAFLS